MNVKDITKKDQNGRTLLHRSLFQNKKETVSMLLATPGINVNIKTENGGSTPLHYACEKSDNSEAVAKLLAAPDIEVNVKNKYGITPIMTAVQWCSKETLKLLVDDHRVNLDESVKSNSGKTLDDLIGNARGTAGERNKCLEMIKKARKRKVKEAKTLSQLLKNLTDTKALNGKDQNGRNLLHRSLYQNNWETVVSLLSTPGIDVNAKTNIGCTPLTFSCGKNNIQAVKLLLAAPDIDVNIKDTFGRTPIMLAIICSRRESLQLMVNDHRVDLDKRLKTNRGDTLDDLVSGTSVERNIYLEMINKARTRRIKEKKTLSWLLENPSKIKALNEKDEHGRNLLHRSLHQNNRKAVVALLNTSGIDVNARTNYDSTPLAYACGEKNNIQAVKMLLEAPGILVNIRDVYGRTPIMIALASCSRESLKLLVGDPRVDLDKRIKSKDGRMLEDFVGLYSEHGNAAKEDCLSIVHEGRKMRTTVSELQQKVVDMERNRDDVQKELKCPVCYEEMKPPTRIWMCTLGHIVCEPCKTNLECTLCPECRTKVTLRAIMAERFARTAFS